MIKNN